MEDEEWEVEAICGEGGSMDWMVWWLVACGKPFGDTLFDWEELEEDCRMKALEDKNAARGWDWLIGGGGPTIGGGVGPVWGTLSELEHVKILIEF